MNQTEKKHEKIKKNKAKKSNIKKEKSERKPMNSVAKSIIKMIIFALLLIFLIFASVKAYHIGYVVFSDTAVDESSDTDVEINIPADATSEEVGELLEYYGLIDNVNVFRLRCILYEAEFYEGTYTLNASMTTEEILDELREEPDSDS